ncbi:mutarotase [Aquimarina sp. AU119]|uniref:mutarotase n=1 Tax=Aquimarina sp. AU119 TaxID=2108528 RepID=UPI000D694D9F|nr:mutarotase [Aquimarina sp. AU119]
MELNIHYDNLWSESLAKFNQNEFNIDPLIESTSDLRRGITLLVRPNNKVKRLISEFIEELKHIDPNQYYYPSTDIHVTVMSIISCYQGFDINAIDISKYIDQITDSLQTTLRDNITFKGITASSSCIMLKGFTKNNSLDTTRMNLRSNFKKTTLEHSIDTRYKIRTAHATIVRFKSEITDPKEFIKVLQKYRDVDFGSFEIDTYELVYNDWYQTKKSTKVLYKFEI